MMAVRQKPVEYKILSNKDATSLSIQVTELLLRDWLLHGDTKFSNYLFMQAMVRVETERMPMPQESNILVPRPILG